MSTTHENERTGPRATDPSAPVRRQGLPRGRASLLALQRAAGNRAVAGALQRGALKPAVAVAAPVPAAAPGADLAVAPAPETAPPASPGKAVQRGWLDDIASSARRSALEAVSNYAKRMPGYNLLCTVLGKDVISDAPVPRTAAKIIDGFLALIPGADKIRQNLQESGATDKAGQWLEEEVPKLGLTWEAIQALFKRAWDALDVTDLADPAGAFEKLRGIFGGPLGRLRDFAVAAGKKLLEFVFEGALTLAGGAGGAVMGIIKRAGGVFDQIVANPMGFLSNLVNAVRGGLGAFLTNIWTHLKNGLVAWLTGGLGGVIRIPERFDLKGILGMALDFLGLTWAKVKGKLGKLIGNDTMDLLEKGVDKLQQGAGFVGDLFKRGLSAITGRIAEFASGLVGQVMDGIKDWVAKSVVGAAITKLISMFNPAGAVIQAIIAIYNTVQFFIERGKQIASLASAVFDSISEIASGNIGRAVSFVEQALAKAVPVVLGFLARLIGLGDIATPVKNVMTKVHTVVDQALDKAMAWVAKVGAPVINLVKRVAGRIRAGVDAGKAWVKGGVASLRDRAKGTVAAVRNFLSVREKLDIDGESHSVYTSGKAPELTVASTPTNLADHPDAGVKSAYQNYLKAVGGAKSDSGRKEAARSKLKPILTALRKWFKQNGKKRGPGAHAPGIGNVAPYNAQPSSQRGSKVEEWFMEKEHVIPDGILRAMLLTLSKWGVKTKSDTRYSQQPTVMIYKGAATEKTDGKLQPNGEILAKGADQDLVRRMRNVAGLVRTRVGGETDNLRKGGSAAGPPAGYKPRAKSAKDVRAELSAQFYSRVAPVFLSLAAKALGRTQQAVAAEQKAVGDKRGKGAPALPTDGQVADAHARQLEHMRAVVQENLENAGFQ